MTEQLGLFDLRVSLGATDVAQSPLRIRESGRARYLTLRVKPPHLLELVVPRGTRAREVTAFVHAHRRWIEDARRELAAVRPVHSEGLPTRIELKAIAESWPVEYRHDATKRARCRARGGLLEVTVRDPLRRDAPALLRDWLFGQAQRHLAPWLMSEAGVVGHRPSSVQIRLQRTRWGSCSTSGTVSLNAALLFVAPEVVRYLLIHELCHFISLNHSRKFWRAVSRFEPDYEALDRRLTAAWDEIPLWAHPEAL